MTGRGALVAVAVPGCVLATACAVHIVLTLLGVHPVWTQRNLNLSEAAGLRDVAEVVRLLERGEDINGSRPIATGTSSEATVQMTPLEAAVASGDDYMIQTLIARGAALDPATWSRLRCGTDRDAVIAVLDAHIPPGVSGCDSTQAR